MGSSNIRQCPDGADERSPSPPPLSPPAASSLYGIARRYCRERILVHPLHWTSRQLELLRISFDEPSPAPPTGRSVYAPRRAGIIHKEGFFEKFHLLDSREKNICGLFDWPKSPVSFSWDSSFQLYLDRCGVVGFPCDNIHVLEEGSFWRRWALPYSIGAYIDRSRIETLRKDSLRRYKCGISNPPVHAIFCREWEKINPTNPVQDPYIVALLIAVAQARREYLLENKPEEVSALMIYPSQVLTSFESTECVHLYKMDIPSSLLDMFDYPTVAPPASPPSSIQILTIPFEPTRTFRDRLLELLLPILPEPSTRNKRRKTRE